MAWDDGLVGVARLAAETDETPLRVIAGPGTGKTFAMKRRVARLLEGGTDANRILVVTFTRTAAADLVRELGALAIEGCEDIRVGTLHAFCFSLLSRHEVLEHLGRYPRPIVTFSTSGVLQFEAAPLLEDRGDALRLRILIISLLTNSGWSTQAKISKPPDLLRTARSQATPQIQGAHEPFLISRDTK